MTQLYQNNLKKIGLNALFLGLLSLSVIFYIQKEKPYYFYTNDTRLFLYIILSIATTFSIHSWVLLPKYFQNRIKEYTIGSIVFGVAFILYLIVVQNIMLYDINYKIELLSLTVPIFSTILVFISFLYSSFFIKEIRLKFLEFGVNIIVFGVLSAFVISIHTTEYFLLSVGAGKHFVRLIPFVKFIPIVAITFYVHTFFIVPLFIKNEKPKYWSDLFILAVLYILGIYAMFFSVIHSLNDYLALTALSILILLVTLFLSFIYGYYRIKFKNISIKVETKTSEINLLKSQVNPHFLFNTLNTLYALALNENAPKTAETTSKLANLLRYMENDIKKEQIPITDEIKYIEDYIAIQRTRCTFEPEIHFTTKNINRDVRISPGLLIPLIENAFKHGVHLLEKATLTITISCDEKNVHFMCKNTYDKTLKVHQMEKGFGSGIQNVQKRLELLYTPNYTFEIDKQNGTFTVSLSIPKK